MPSTPKAQLAKFLSEYTPEVAAEARRAIAAMRKQLPGLQELVYDNYNALVVGWSTNGRASGAVCSIAVYPRWVTLFFMWGVRLPDPEQRLSGKGKQVRQVRLETAKTIEEPAIRALIDAAVEDAGAKRVPGKTPGPKIQSISPIRRRRTPAR